MDRETLKPERKRQARGEARIKSLLEAAEVVFARDGYHSATTNMISATAGVSPATLYQFFSNKEAIANALMVDYADRISQLHDVMQFDVHSTKNVRTMMEHVMMPLVAFHREHPAFMTLIVDAPLDKETWAAKHALSDRFVSLLASMFQTRNRDLKVSDAKWMADMCMVIYKGFLSEIAAANGADRERLVETMIDVLARYLAPGLESRQETK